jgi:hypothetical protein
MSAGGSAVQTAVCSASLAGRSDADRHSTECAKLCMKTGRKGGRYCELDCESCEFGAVVSSDKDPIGSTALNNCIARCWQDAVVTQNCPVEFGNNVGKSFLCGGAITVVMSKLRCVVMRIRCIVTL